MAPCECASALALTLRFVRARTSGRKANCSAERQRDRRLSCTQYSYEMGPTIFRAASGYPDFLKQNFCGLTQGVNRVLVDSTPLLTSSPNFEIFHRRNAPKRYNELVLGLHITTSNCKSINHTTQWHSPTQMI